MSDLFIAACTAGIGFGSGVLIVVALLSPFTSRNGAKEKRREFIRANAGKIYIELMRDGTEERYDTQKIGEAIYRAEMLWKDIEESDGGEA